jgi:hypothetical protein
MSLTLNNEVWNKYQRACDVSNHGASGGDVAAMMEMLLDDYLKHHDVVAMQRPGLEFMSTKIRNASRELKS